MHRTHRKFQDLGPAQQRFLLRAMSEGVALDDPLATAKMCKVDWDPRPTRAQVLEHAGLIHKRTSKKGRTSWRVTDVGRSLVMAHTPVFLHRRGFPSYTSQPWRAMFAEPEVIGEAA